MKGPLTLSLVVIAAILAATTVTSLSIKAENAEQGKKCECYDGEARCFFDGSRCPVSGGKCKCFKSPVQSTVPENRGRENSQNGACCNSIAATEFCESRCPVKVGGQTCGAQCRLKKSHSGKHLCLKLHDF